MISFVLSISGPFRQSWPNSSSRLDADERKPIVQGTQSSHQVPVGAELRLCKFPPPSLVRRLLGKFCHAAGNNLWHVSPLPQYENFGKLFPSFLGTTNCFLGTFYATKVISIVFGNYKLLFGSFLCNKSFFHFFGGNYKLLLGNFFATKAALVSKLVYGTFVLLGNEKLWFFKLFLGTTNCFFGTFYATKYFPLVLGTNNCCLGTLYATKVISIAFGNYKLLLGNFLCNKSYFHHFWGRTTNCFLGTFYATKVISIVLGNYKLLLGNFLCNKSYFHRFWELQIASWELFMQQKLPWCVAHFIL